MGTPGPQAPATDCPGPASLACAGVGTASAHRGEPGQEESLGGRAHLGTGEAAFRDPGDGQAPVSAPGQGEEGEGSPSQHLDAK